MRKFFLPVLLLALLLIGANGGSRAEVATAATLSATAQPTDALLFDDFNYRDVADSSFTENGWIPRTVAGWPGIQGATWLKSNISFADDPAQKSNRLMQLTSSTDGSAAGTKQTQVCQQRNFMEGTYATRVHFTDTPAAGKDGDQVVETFYMISPYTKPMDPKYSEMDFEYLPNGGWGDSGSIFHMTTWYTVQIEPWNADNRNNHLTGSFEGWHTLVMQVANNHVKYYVDGQLVADHSGKYYPRVPVSINYNLWFIADGFLKSSETRTYVEQVDWMLFAANQTLSPKQIAAKVDVFRLAAIRYQSSIPAQQPPLDSPCDL